jgi:hypothetical protein
MEKIQKFSIFACMARIILGIKRLEWPVFGVFQSQKLFKNLYARLEWIAVALIFSLTPPPPHKFAERKDDNYIFFDWLESSIENIFIQAIL